MPSEEAILQHTPQNPANMEHPGSSASVHKEKDVALNQTYVKYEEPKATKDILERFKMSSNQELAML
jgi:hypothetical protein